MRGVFLTDNSTSGMTLIELLISLSIFLTVASMIPVVFSYWNSPISKTISHEERVLFIAQLQLDFRASDRFYTNAQGTIFYFIRTSDGATIQYELYQDKVRRRVNRTGHEVFLQWVKGIYFQATDHGVTIQIQGIDNTVYESTVIHPQHFKTVQMK